METTPVGAVAFPEPDVLDERLGAFLDMRGMSKDAVLKEADQGMGTPALAVAAGSVLAGFGNIRSDLDLLVLVENENLIRFPIQSHEHGTLIDVSIRRASTVKASTAELPTVPWPRFATVTEDAWNHRRRALNTASRLALGLPLVVTSPWGDWHAGLRGPWLREAVRQWWTVEAHRLALAAGWLLGAKPLAAGIRAREAVGAALNARAAAGGELYFAAKWVGEKLKVLGDAEGLALLRETLTPADPRERVPRCLDIVEQLVGGAAPLHAVLRWATGAGAMELDDRTVVDRWQLRALEVRRRGLPPDDSEAVIWSGPAGTVPPEDLLSLFTHNMVWLGVAHPDPEVPA
ncbi:hypothetical protein [Streptomyces iconiensis]|uniref:Nucleotidyltransferase domain-containing protein n=1 Tax=Streptomyces iconiensis TaxID=1384038 RepID=A0ABT6ZNZ2_9ACTN|nr:hypothetical protein [Streptomyces iconiensis]MDJ1130771.1 hypothetical protein [Streptomyces iconiensis]